jgi:hypothetical protein
MSGRGQLKLVGVAQPSLRSHSTPISQSQGLAKTTSFSLHLNSSVPLDIQPAAFASASASASASPAFALAATYPYPFPLHFYAALTVPCAPAACVLYHVAHEKQTGHW